MQRRSSGWTIVELAVALAVLGILAAIAGPLYQGYRERALVGQAVADMGTISTRVRAFRTEFGQFPSALDAAMRDVPEDPWGNPYRYLRLEGASPSIRAKARKDRNLVPINSDYDLYSMGADQQSQAPLAAPVSQDDVIRANDGGFLGRASNY